MNLYTGQVTIRDGRALFEGKGFSLNLADSLMEHANEEIEIGIRPEDARITHAEGIRLKAEVEMVSNIGSEIYVHARIGRERITVKAPKDAPLKAGQTLFLAVAPSALHLFQKGRRL